jgi:16S rRNA (cytosine967-C5)-methyltransferase
VTERAGVAARRTAAEALQRIEVGGAYANLVLPSILGDSGLSSRDRGFVTELVYGSTRMRRACDAIVDRFVVREPDALARTWLRLGTYQIVFLATPPHAAVSSTVEAAPRKIRGFLNAVLRRVATATPDWPSDAARLSYPDWVVERLLADLGEEAGLGALAAMNRAPVVTERDDGYTQDLASQWVTDLVGAAVGELVFDAAAAPGGKATGMARAGATVVAGDVRPSRTGLIAGNAARLGLPMVLPLAADARRPPFRPGRFDRVVLDAPCSGLGTLRRRPDARWRIEADAVGALALLQRQMVDALVPLVRPGGTFVYSVCTLTSQETAGVDDHLTSAHPDLQVLDPPGEPWQPWGRGALLLPQVADTDGMFVLRLRVPG